MLGLQCQPATGSQAPRGQQQQPDPDAAGLMRAPSSGPASPGGAGSYTPVGSPASSQPDGSTAGEPAPRRDRVSSSSSSSSSSTGSSVSSRSPASPNLQQMRRSPPPLANHLKLINQHQQASAGSKRPASPQTEHRLGQHHHQDHHHARSAPAGRHSAGSLGPSSPGYHSAAPSPSSSAASPVSSSSSSASSAACSSSGVSTSSFGSLCSSSSPTGALGSFNPANSRADDNNPAAANESPPNGQQQVAAAAAPPLASATPAANPVAAGHSQAPPQGPNAGSQPPTGPLAGASGPNQPAAPSQQQLARPSQNQQPACQPHLLDYYPSVRQDGINLSWFHGANNRASLGAALVSDRLIIAGDISLAEMSRYPVPIMARPPLGASDLTLENWLQTVARTQRGIKLTFTSTRTVEPAFRVLARHTDQLKGPLILSADILSWPSAQAKTDHHGRSRSTATASAPSANIQQPVDAWTFLMLCRTRFPKSIISIGWCPPDQQQQQQQRGQTPSGHDLIVGPQPRLSSPSSAGSGGAVAGNESLGSGVSPPPAGADPIFELDLVMEHPELISGALSQHIQQLASAGRQLAQSGPASRLHSLSQRLGSAASAGASAMHLFQMPGGPLHHQHAGSLGQLGRNQLHQQQQQQQHLHLQHQLLASTGSLNSSSGNSSGSPSPTSPVGHHNHHSQHHHQHHQHHQQRSGGWHSLAAMAQSADNQLLARHLADHQHQLPLNLNINEADPRHAGARATSLGLELAHRIQSMQQQHTIRQHRSSLAGANPFAAQTGSQSFEPLPVLSEHPAARPSSASLFNSNPASAGPPAGLMGLQPTSWPHVNKKPALSQQHHHQQLSRRLGSSSPNQQPMGANLLCVKAPATPRQEPAPMALDSAPSPAGARQSAAGAGYTREMIDKMASLCKEYNLTQPVTFPVEAKLLVTTTSHQSHRPPGAGSSLEELQRLLYQVGPNSTLTIVAQQEDLIKVDDLLAIRRQFAANQVLFDVPEELAAALRQELDS